jgi:hypothetical protein
MPRISDIHSIIVPAENQICQRTHILKYMVVLLVNIVINGVTVSIGQSKCSCLVRSVSGGTGCYL